MLLKRLAAACAAASLLVPAGAVASAPRPLRTAAQRAAIAERDAQVAALRKRVKYVFVLYQENRSFDSYFGTFPGAEGIYSHPASQTLGYNQQIEDTNGNMVAVPPFRIGPAQYAADTDDVDHSHPRLISKIDVTSAGPQMDQFGLIEEQKHIPQGQTLPTLQAKQYGELVMAHEDCDTIPLLWNYANRFVLFDHVFQNYLGPSTPGNIAIVSAQAGETQYGLHPSEAYTDNGSGLVPGVPVLNDRDPAWGPYNPGDGANPSNEQYNLTFASLPLTLAGGAVGKLPATDPTASTDFADVGDDLKAIAKTHASPAGWGWFQEGFDQEPTYPQGQYLNYYVTHHNGPQYFGYVANSAEKANLHGLGDFDTALASGALPQQGGVFYVKGGFQNIYGLKPADPDPAVQTNFNGDDDHPGYSDAQISEALVAESVNRIAKSKYWSQSAIVIAYDDSEGDYDHVAPPLRSIGPGVGNSPQDFLSDGPRIPLIVISPFAKTHVVSHAYGDQGSVVKFIDAVFGLPTLAGLPDEIKGEGNAEALGHLNFGPDDGTTSAVDDLLDAFDHKRLTGQAAPLPPSYAIVPENLIMTLPQQSGFGCTQLGIVTVDRARGIRNQIPADFNPRPGTDPTQARVKPVNTRADVMRAKDADD